MTDTDLGNIGSARASLRRHACSLENVFFFVQDHVLLESRKKLQQMSDSVESLARVSGIEDPDVLRSLAELNVRPETLASLAIIPLLEVAWADGMVSARERSAILKAAGALRTKNETVDLALLERWLALEPEPGLVEAWARYTRALVARMPPAEGERMKTDLLGQAEKIAEASGGLLGLGHKVSKKEQAVLDKLKKELEAET
jgi:hypothetical protein